jgi:6-pyruvoyltetrahydropterin/6-carboxytetrahydropterin synthase
MYVGRVEISFDAGHRLLHHRGKCAAPHGHTYRAEVLIATTELNPLGLAVDFGDIKAPLKAWIDAHWDHAFLLGDADTTLRAALESVPESKLYVFQSVNPSAEAMAETLFGVARRALGDVVRSVRIWESTTQYAEFIPADADAPARAYAAVSS